MLRKVLFSGVLFTSAFSIPVQAMDESAPSSNLPAQLHFSGAILDQALQSPKKSVMYNDDFRVDVEDLLRGRSSVNPSDSYEAMQTNGLAYTILKEETSRFDGGNFVPGGPSVALKLTFVSSYFDLPQNNILPFPQAIQMKDFERITTNVGKFSVICTGAPQHYITLILKSYEQGNLFQCTQRIDGETTKYDAQGQPIPRRDSYGNVIPGAYEKKSTSCPMFSMTLTKLDD